MQVSDARGWCCWAPASCCCERFALMEEHAERGGRLQELLKSRCVRANPSGTVQGEGRVMGRIVGC